MAKEEEKRIEDLRLQEEQREAEEKRLQNEEDDRI